MKKYLYPFWREIQPLTIVVIFLFFDWVFFRYLNYRWKPERKKWFYYKRERSVKLNTVAYLFED